MIICWKQYSTFQKYKKYKCNELIKRLNKSEKSFKWMKCNELKGYVLLQYIYDLNSIKLIYV